MNAIVLDRRAAAPAGPQALDLLFKAAMRELGGGVAVITTGVGEERTGLTATSLTSLSVDPPTLLFCVNLASSTWPVLRRAGCFGASLLAPHHRPVADRFAGRGGIKGPARYEGAEWVTLETGAPLLADAVAALDCEVQEAIERHSHAIVIGRVRGVRLGGESAALAYRRGGYGLV